MLLPEESENYAYLPDELLEDILEGVPEVSREVQEAFERLNQRREAMRRLLTERKRIYRAADLEAVSSPSVAAVDGGLAIEKSIGADAVLVVGVGVEGLVREDKRRWDGIQYSHWQKVLSHEGEDARRFALGVMAALELEIAAQAPHDVVIYDGSHLTPVIGLNSMLSLAYESLIPLAVEVLEKHQTVKALRTFFTRPGLVAMVKYDTSRELAMAWLGEEGTNFDDRTLMTMLLEPGEYTMPVAVAQTPRRKEQWEELHITIAYPDFPNREELAKELEEAIRPATRHQIYVTYYRPWEWAPAYRIELKQDAVRSSTRLATILQAIREQVVSPEIREPYPQYLADQMAKSVGAGLRALQSAVSFELAEEGADRLLRMLMQSYRTE